MASKYTAGMLCIAYIIFSNLWSPAKSCSSGCQKWLMQYWTIYCGALCAVVWMWMFYFKQKKITGEMLQSNSVMNIQQTSHKRLCLGEAEKANELPDSALFISIRQSAILTPFYASKRKLQEVCLNAWLDCQRRARVHKHLHDSQEFLAVSNYSSLVLQ